VPDGVAADPQLSGQVQLAGQAAAGADMARLDEAAQRRLELAVQGRVAVRREQLGQSAGVEVGLRRRPNVRTLTPRARCRQGAA
jgi:hypothetical protein